MLAVHDPAPTAWWRTLARQLGATTFVGLLLGLLIGGVGGRIAMRVIFLTSDPGVRGIESDDGFLIGQFTMDTVNLLVTGALFGLVGAFVYLGVRPWLLGPPWLRAVTCSVAAGAMIGSVVIIPDGVDFTALSPTALAVALFIAIPSVFAFICPFAVERALRPGGWAWSGRFGWVVAPLAVFLFPPVLIVLGAPVALILVVRWLASQSSRSVPAVVVRWGGRLGWGGLAIFGFVMLTEDLLALG